MRYTCPMSNRAPKVGDQIVYWDDEKTQMFGWICSVPEPHNDICNLAIFLPDGKLRTRKLARHATHNGICWKIMEHWAFPDEVPESEWM